MTIRRYYTDATTTRFTGSIVDRVNYEGRPAVVLEETYFYPSSGGQPYDTGLLRDGDHLAAVIDVVTTAPDAPVLHVLDRPWAGGDVVSAEIDWPRRFDHMQQHTGQHILSQAFIRVADAQTVGFHLSDQTVTIDLDKSELSPGQLTATERLANDVIWANMPVAIRIVDLAGAEQLNLRKLPAKHDGQIRLIAIGDFDLTACGGTHVAATGQVGLLKLVKLERRGDLNRIEFRCGGRALADYGRKNDIAMELSNNLTTGYDDLIAAVEKLKGDARHWRSAASSLQKTLTAHEVDKLIRETAVTNGQRIVVAVLTNCEPDEVKQLANGLMTHDHTVALLALNGERTHFIFGRSADAAGHMGDFLRAVLAQLDGAKGGGNATMAQGSGPALGEMALADLLEEVRNQLQQTIKPVE